MTQPPPARQAVQRTVKDWIAADSFKLEVSKMLPKIISPDYFVRIALNAAVRRADISECTPASVMACLLECASFGLLPNGRDAHLIPFNDTRAGRKVCTLILDYKGIANIIRRSGEVKSIHADVVCEKDDFDYQFGTGHFLRHKRAMKDRGKPLCAYSYVVLTDGAEDFDVMEYDAIEKTRTRSKAANNGPWVSDWEEMAKKTVFRRHSKFLPFSPMLLDQLHREDEQESLTEHERFSRARPVGGISFDMPTAEPSDQSATSDPSDTAAESAAGLAPSAKPSPKPRKAPAPAPQPPATPSQAAEPPDTAESPHRETKPIQDELADELTSRGVSFDDFRDWSITTGRLKQDTAESLGSFSDLPTDFCQQLQNDPKALAHCVKIYGKKE